MVDDMKIKEDEKILDEIIEEYNKDPEGWKVSGSRKGSRLDFYITKKGKFWQLKSEIINPYKKIGVGGKIKSKAELNHNIYFGWRPLTRKQMRRIIKELRIEGKVSYFTMKEVLQISPKSFFDIDEDYIFQGPIAISNKPLQKVSKKQKKLDLKLTEELNKLVFYNGGSMYR